MTGGRSYRDNEKDKTQVVKIQNSKYKANIEKTYVVKRVSDQTP